MAEKYFDKFPAVLYGNNFAINITERAALKAPAPNTPYAYYSYDISNGLRADQISDEYYNDQYMDWLLYLANGTIDPYYQWYLTAETFNSFLIAKYNTPIINLQNKVAYYRNNWYVGDIISVSDYAALPSNHHRYWQPQYNQDTGQVIAYVRLPVDWQINTNAVVSVSCVGTSFTNNEVVYLNFDSTHVGRGQVSFANSTSLIIQHVSGSLYSTITGSSYIYGSESGSNVVFTATTSLANNIVTGEEIYWDPVSMYDVENEKNEKNKTIRIIDNGLSMSISKQLSDLLVQ
jgi:Base plate wedge protein 53